MAFLHLNAGVEKRVRRSNQHLTRIVKQNDSRASAVAASLSAYARSDAAENICTYTIIAELEQAIQESSWCSYIYLPQPGV